MDSPVAEGVCQTCLQLDYRKFNYHYSQRKPLEMKKGFPLDRLSYAIKTQILTKMDQNSFIRMRRSNSEYSEFIERHRKQLPIAVFHFMAGSLRHGNDLFGWRRIEPVVLNLSPAISFSTNRRKSKRKEVLPIVLNSFNENMATELFGCFKLASLSYEGNMFHGMGEEQQEEFDQQLEIFLTLSRLFVDSLTCSWIDSSRISHICSKVQPRILHLKDCRNVSQIFLKIKENSWFQNLTRFFCDEDTKLSSTIVSHLEMIECRGDFDFIGLLEKWRQGESAIRHLKASSPPEVSVGKLEGRYLPGKEAKKYVKNIVGFHKRQFDRNIRFYLLSQKTTNKKGILVLFKNYIHFKLVE